MNSIKYSQTIIYRDPFGHYSIQVPSLWDISSEMTTKTCSDQTGSSDCKVAGTAFMANRDDEYMFQNMGIGVVMSIIDTPFLSYWFHKSNYVVNAKLGGVDAHYSNIMQHYIINTSHAHFQVTIVLPEGYRRGGFISSHDIQAPLPPISREQYEIIQELIHTFTPTPDNDFK